RPQPFEYKARYPVLKRVDLPANPYDVPPGTDQQKMWDRQRQASR
ncbi:MAG: L,D-transpeptidase, partial [Bacteroidetes bacterium QH_6_63_17]